MGNKNGKLSKKPKDTTALLKLDPTQSSTIAKDLFKTHDLTKSGFLGHDEMTSLVTSTFLNCPDLQSGLPGPTTKLSDFVFDLCHLQKNPAGVSLPEFTHFLHNRLSFPSTNHPSVYTFRILVLGNSNSGKTSMTRWFTENRFPQPDSGIMGMIQLRGDHDRSADPYVQLLVDYGDNVFVKFQIWDTGGQEKFRSIGSSFYRGAKGILLVYDINDPSTFHDIPQWKKEVERYGERDVKVLFVGNKMDLERKVEKEDHEKMKEKLAIPEDEYFESSALLGQNVEKVFFALGAKILKQMDGTEGPSVETRISNVTRFSSRDFYLHQVAHLVYWLLKNVHPFTLLPQELSVNIMRIFTRLLRHVGYK